MSVFTGVVRLLAGAVLLLGVGLTLTACGGGAAGTPILGGGAAGGSATSDLTLTVDKTTVPNSGAETVTVSVTAIDVARNVVGSAPVSVSVDSNAFVTPSGSTTDKTTGQITAVVSIGSDHSNRTVTVTATSGSISRSISFDVVTSVNTVPKAADLSMRLDKTSISDSGSEVVTVTVTAVDASRNALPLIPVSFKVDQKAVLIPGGSSTDAEGNVKAAVSIGDDNSNRLITVTASSGTLVRTAFITVTGAKLLSTAVPGTPKAGDTGNQIQYQLNDVSGNGKTMAGMPIAVTAPGLPSATGTTDSNGAYVYTYTAPSTPGSINITASAGGATSVQTVTITSGASTIPAAVGPVISHGLTASPTVVAVNTGSTVNLSQIRAMFLAANNAPLRNVRVRFDLDGDQNNIGGSLSSGTSLVYSDESGVATANYMPGSIPSPTNGVTVRACWDYNDFDLGTCPNSELVNLTVVSGAISVSIGTNNLIQIGASGLTYVKQFVLQVVDSAGNAKSGVEITPSVDLVSYYKGYYTWVPALARWVQTVTIGCPNEDINRNGKIDAGDDTNANGTLEPRQSDVAIRMINGNKTDLNGTAILQIEYPQSVASWVSFKITASASGVVSPPAYFPVVGTEAVLPVESSAITTENPPPAFVKSPYGTGLGLASCANTN